MSQSSGRADRELPPSHRGAIAGRHRPRLRGDVLGCDGQACAPKTMPTQAWSVAPGHIPVRYRLYFISFARMTTHASSVQRVIWSFPPVTTVRILCSVTISPSTTRAILPPRFDRVNVSVLSTFSRASETVSLLMPRPVLLHLGHAFNDERNKIVRIDGDISERLIRRSIAVFSSIVHQDNLGIALRFSVLQRGSFAKHEVGSVCEGMSC